jgi:signal transduction histidine kinase
MEAVGQLASGIAHDFRNLLTIISGNLEMLALDRSHNRREERVLVAEAWRVTDLMAQLTTNLLAFARQGQIDCIPTDIGQLATTTARFLSRILGERIGLEIQAVTGLNAKINAAQFQTVLINLAANARDAMPEGGRVAIQVDEAFVGAEEARKMHVTSGRYATVSVTDNGPGMRKETLGHAFDLFFTTKPACNGLGLAAVREFAANVGGTTRIRSKLGNGTTVELWIPVEDGSSQPLERDFPDTR